MWYYIDVESDVDKGDNKETTMVTISNNLIELNGNKSELPTAEELLKQLGFQITSESNITYEVTLPSGWTKENRGQFHTVLYGPNHEEIWSYVKYSQWDQHSFLEVYEY